jgi:hypothetical protein
MTFDPALQISLFVKLKVTNCAPRRQRRFARADALERTHNRGSLYFYCIFNGAACLEGPIEHDCRAASQ